MAGGSVTKTIIASLSLGLYMTVFFSFVISVDNAGYNTSIFNNDTFVGFNNFNKTLTEVNAIGKAIDKSANSDRSLFDILGDIFAKAFAPFKLTLSSIKLLKENLGLLGAIITVGALFIKYLLAVITVIFFVRIFLFKILFKTDDRDD